MEINTVRHSVEAFRSFLEDRTGRPSSNDYAWPPKRIYYFLNMYRNKVSFEDNLKDSMLNLDEGIKLTIPCIELEEVDVTSDCPCAPAKGCTWLKSKHKLPKFLGGLPLEITTIDGSTSFDYVPWTKFEDRVVKSRLKAQRRQPHYTMRNINSSSHVYLYTNSPLTESGDLVSASVEAIFKNPLEVYQFPICGQKPDESCAPLDQEFTIEEELQTQVFELTLNALLALSQAATGSDILDNRNNDTKAQAPV